MSDASLWECEVSGPHNTGTSYQVSIRDFNDLSENLTQSKNYFVFVSYYITRGVKKYKIKKFSGIPGKF